MLLFTSSMFVGGIDDDESKCYVKIENHRGKARLFTCTFSKLTMKITSNQRDHSEMILGKID